MTASEFGPDERDVTIRSRVVLVLPISDEALLPALVDKWVSEKVSLIAIVGEGCQRIEDEIDWLIIGDGSDRSRFVTTSSHPGETLEHVMEFATLWSIDGCGPTMVVRI